MHQLLHGAAHGEHAGLLEHLKQLRLRQLLLALLLRQPAGFSSASHPCLHALQRLELLHDGLGRLVVLHVAHIVRGAAARVSSTRRSWPVTTYLGPFARTVQVRLARPSDMARRQQQLRVGHVGRPLVAQRSATELLTSHGRSPRCALVVSAPSTHRDSSSDDHAAPPARPSGAVCGDLAPGRCAAARAPSRTAGAPRLGIRAWRRLQASLAPAHPRPCRPL